MGDPGSLLGDPSDPSLGASEDSLGGFGDSAMPGSLGGEEESLGDFGGLGDSDMSGLMGDSGSDLGLEGGLTGAGGAEDDMSSLLGSDSMSGSELSALSGEGFAGAASAEDEPENPCSCTHHLLECEISDQLVSLSEQERSTTMTSMFAWACDQPSGCAYLNDPNQLLHCSDYQKLSWVYNEYYKAKGKSPENCNWSGYAQLAQPTEPTANCQSMLGNMGFLDGGVDQGMSAALPEGLAEDPLSAGGEDLGLGDDFASMGGESSGLGDELSAMGGDSSAPTDDFSSLGGDSMLGGEGAEGGLSSLTGGGADSMLGDLSGDGSAPIDSTSGLGGEGALPDDITSLMGDTGAGAADFPSDDASASAGGRPELAESAFKQKRDWRARRA